ncbi:MAG: hypothetical protein JWQ38_2756 [Flavipsychrobacter sp.]|nr:hypothetical protein [Flavipsychrobacter sp.]
MDIEVCSNGMLYRWYIDRYYIKPYCMDVKHMTYAQVLKDNTKEEEVRGQMMEWYSNTKQRNDHGI